MPHRNDSGSPIERRERKRRSSSRPEREYESRVSSMDSSGSPSHERSTFLSKGDALHQKKREPRKATIAKRRNSSKKREKIGRKRGRRSPHRWILFGLFLWIPLLFLFLMKAPLFDIASVQLEGNELVPSEEIFDAAGELEGNLFCFPVSRLKERISEIQGIEWVKVKRKWPNALVIQVKESYVLAKIVLADRTYYVLNDGIVTDEFHEETNRVTPFEIEMDEVHPVIGKPLFKDERQLDFLQVLRRTTFADGVTKVRFDQAQNINIMYNQLIVRFGSPNDILKKLSNLMAVMEEVKNNGVKAKEIILNEGETPIVVTENIR